MPKFLTDDGVTLVYDDLGPRAGIPVVLCHGLASSAAQHAADAEYLAARGYRVLVPDIRGHGRSGKPPNMSAASFTAARMADDLMMMLDEAGVGPMHWVGNSLGGILGLELVGRDEARFRTIATFATTYSLRLPRFASYAIPWAHAVFGPERYSRAAARGMSRDPAAQALIADVLRRWDPHVGLLVAQNLCSYDFIPKALNARLPILMLRGGHDPQVNVVLGPTLRAMRGQPNFSLVEIPPGGHCANLDATEQVREELLRFWRG